MDAQQEPQHTPIQVNINDDYAAIEGEHFEIYYGYEFGPGGEYGAVYRRKQNNREYRMGHKKLTELAELDPNRRDDMAYMLLGAIGVILESHVIVAMEMNRG